VVMTTPHEKMPAEMCAAEGLILEMVAEGEPIDTNLEGLARAVGLPPEDLRACLHELVGVGWIVVDAEPDGRVRIRLQD
jgi:DNA-binding IclR family transcriptional regulator